MNDEEEPLYRQIRRTGQDSRCSRVPNEAWGQDGFQIVPSYLLNLWVAFIAGIVYLNLLLTGVEGFARATLLFVGPLMIFDSRGEIGLVTVGRSILDKQIGWKNWSWEIAKIGAQEV